MKKLAAIFAAALLLMGTAATGAFAQDNNQEQRPPREQRAPGKGFDREAWAQKVQAEKIAFLTSQLNLTPEEAQVFWPVYNQAQAEKREAMKKVNDLSREMKQAVKDEKSDKEIEKLIKAYVEAQEELVEVDAKFTPKFLKVLPAAKVAKLINAEERFKKLQFQNVMGGKDGKAGPGRQPRQGEHRQGFPNRGAKPEGGRDIPAEPGQAI